MMSQYSTEVFVTHDRQKYSVEPFQAMFCFAQIMKLKLARLITAISNYIVNCKDLIIISLLIIHY